MYRQRLARRLRRLADELDPPAELDEGEEVHLDGQAGPARHAEAQRTLQTTTLELLDPEVRGYIVIWTRYDDEYPDGQLRIRGSVPNDEWPAYLEAIARIGLSREEFTQ